jgi:hypothetical protein
MFMIVKTNFFEKRYFVLAVVGLQFLKNYSWLRLRIIKF